MAESPTTLGAPSESEPLNAGGAKRFKGKPKGKAAGKNIVTAGPGLQNPTESPGSGEKLIEAPLRLEDKAGQAQVDSDELQVADPAGRVRKFRAGHFHNAFFEPNIQAIIKSLLINLTSPIYFLYRWTDMACEAWDKRKIDEKSGKDEGSHLANCAKSFYKQASEHLSAEWCYMCPFQTAINCSVLAWSLAADRSQVPLSEVFLPLWFQAGMSLSTAATRNLDSGQWARLKEKVGNKFKTRLTKLVTSSGGDDDHVVNCSKKDVNELVEWLWVIFQVVDGQSYNWRLERWQCFFLLLLGLCFRRISRPAFWAGVTRAHQILLLIDLHRKFVNCAHESLTERMLRLRRRKSWKVKLPKKFVQKETSNSSTKLNECEKCEDECWDGWGNSGDELLPKDEITREAHKKNLAPFMADYRDAYLAEEVGLDKLAEQLLVGWPEALDTGATQVIGGLLAVFLSVVAALLPDYLREDHKQVDFKLPEDDGCKAVSVMFWSMMYLHFYVCFVYPRGIMFLFTEMSKAYRIFSIMLTDQETAARHYVPYVRVDKPEDILAWYELYNYFILSTKRRKFSLEFSFAFNLFTLLAMIALNAWYIVFPMDMQLGWQPGVLFCETLVVLVSFLLFSMPPLFMGLRVNMLRRRTIDLLLGHAGEARAFYLTGAKQSGTLEGDVEEARAEIKDLESIARAVDMAETIASRLRLDSWLVVRTMGVELTVAQFTAIASLLSTALVYAARNAETYVGFWTTHLQKLGIAPETQPCVYASNMTNITRLCP